MLVTGSTQLRSAQLNRAMRDSCQTISSSTPNATKGWNSAAMYSSGLERRTESGSPRFRKKSPKGLEKITIDVQIQVFRRRRAVSDVMPGTAGRVMSCCWGQPLAQHEIGR